MWDYSRLHLQANHLKAIKINYNKSDSLTLKIEDAAGLYLNHPKKLAYLYMIVNQTFDHRIDESWIYQEDDKHPLHRGILAKYFQILYLNNYL